MSIRVQNIINEITNKFKFEEILAWYIKYFNKAKIDAENKNKNNSNQISEYENNIKTLYEEVKNELENNYKKENSKFYEEIVKDLDESSINGYIKTIYGLNNKKKSDYDKIVLKKLLKKNKISIKEINEILVTKDKKLKDSIGEKSLINLNELILMRFYKELAKKTSYEFFTKDKLQNYRLSDKSPILSRFLRKFEVVILEKMLTIASSSIQTQTTIRDDNSSLVYILSYNPFDYQLHSLIISYTNYHLQHFDEKFENRKIKFVLAMRKDIQPFLHKMELGEDVEIAMESLENFQYDFAQDSSKVDIKLLVNNIIYQAYKSNASDIHFEPTEDEFKVRFRKDGILGDELEKLVSKSRVSEIVARVKIMANMDVAEKRKPQDGRIASTGIEEDKKMPFDIRVSTFPTVHGEKVVMRILKKDSIVNDITNLAMGDDRLELLINKLSLPQGFILVTGPTGSGKTTTLYTALNHIDKKTKNILTIEEPVEYHLEGIHQMDIKPKIGVTFASALKTILRQDPDVIMVGEIRDRETAEAAIESSLTGHLVLSTLHTNSAIGAITRLKNLKIDSYLIADSLSLIIAQRLVRTLCENCKIPVAIKEDEKLEKIYHGLRGDKLERALKDSLEKEKKEIDKKKKDVDFFKKGFTFKHIESYLYAIDISKEKLELIGITLEELRSNKISFYKSDGCANCRYTGYKDRVGIFEVLNITDEIKMKILEPNFSEKSIKSCIKDEAYSLNRQAFKLFKKGDTTLEEIARVLSETKVEDDTTTKGLSDD